MHLGILTWSAWPAEAQPGHQCNVAWSLVRNGLFCVSETADPLDFPARSSLTFTENSPKMRNRALSSSSRADGALLIPEAGGE